MLRKLTLLILPLTVGACAIEPAYPIVPTADHGPAPPPAVASSLSATPSPSPDAPTYYRPQPIPGAPPPPDEAGAGARGRRARGQASRARSAAPAAVETPRMVTVRPGESLFEVAERVRTPIRVMIDLNGLQPPYEVSPGQVLRVPPPGAYTVRTGDTLMSISRRFSIDARSLASLNDIALEGLLKPGQRLVLPSPAKDSHAESLAIRPAGATLAVKPKPVQTEPNPPPPGVAQAQASAKPPAAAASELAPVSPSVAVAAGKGRFAWPVKGEILSGFGPKGPGQRNDGVNIAAEAGDPVLAAAAGQVVYAGATIPGFGNLVVIKHPDGWTSLYGNLGKIAVKIRAEVAQGQPLGVAGLSGAVDRPQVHFEVRYAATPQEKAQPVDPQALLP